MPLVKKAAKEAPGGDWWMPTLRAKEFGWSPHVFNPLMYGLFSGMDFASGTPLGGVVAGNLAADAAAGTVHHYVGGLLGRSKFLGRHGFLKSVLGMVPSILATMPAYAAGEAVGSKFFPIYSVKDAKEKVVPDFVKKNAPAPGDYPGMQGKDAPAPGKYDGAAGNDKNY